MGAHHFLSVRNFQRKEKGSGRDLVSVLFLWHTSGTLAEGVRVPCTLSFATRAAKKMSGPVIMVMVGRTTTRLRHPSVESFAVARGM